MNRGLPPAVMAPARANLLRATGDRQDLSLTVTIEDGAASQGRRFAFRAVREPDGAARGSGAAPAFLVTDARTDPMTALDHAEVRSSAPFLAGAIAQARPSPVLHNPPYREAACAYRQSDDLGVAGSRPGFRSDTRV